MSSRLDHEDSGLLRLHHLDDIQATENPVERELGQAFQIVDHSDNEGSDSKVFVPRIRPLDGRRASSFYIQKNSPLPEAGLGEEYNLSDYDYSSEDASTIMVSLSPL